MAGNWLIFEENTNVGAKPSRKGLIGINKKPFKSNGGKNYEREHCTHFYDKLYIHIHNTYIHIRCHILPPVGKQDDLMT